MDIKQRLVDIAAVVDARLEELFLTKKPALLWDSMAYSIKAGGKRLRPALNILAAELLEVPMAQTLDIACALEMIHTYSLIHDDLPALDDDALRRGKPSNHMVYGEAQAILAGDGLLSYAFEVMLNNAMAYSGNMRAQLAAVRRVSVAAGVHGMVAGQVLDVALEGQAISEADLIFIHTHKTADMIVGALLSGAELGCPTEQQCAALTCYGQNVGLVFQIVDDVLDVTADASLGKTTGKDARAHKTTFASRFGVKSALALAGEYNQKAKQSLAIFGEKASALCALADEMLTRKK